MRKIRVRLFGQTTVVLPDNATVTDFGGARPRQILEILAAAVDTPVSKDRLVQQLWEGRPPRTYSDTLKSYVALLRRRMGVSSGRSSPLATTCDGYVLDSAAVEVDLDTFRRLVDTPRGTTSAATLRRTDAALRLVTGPLLANEPYADWAVQERNRFQSDYLRACDRGATEALAGSRPHLAVEIARKAIGCDAMSETSWQLLIRGLAMGGARNEALRAYLDLRRALTEGLGTEPSAESQALYVELLGEDSHESRTSSTRVQEVRALLALLREAMDGCPDFHNSTADRHRAEHREPLLATA